MAVEGVRGGVLTIGFVIVVGVVVGMAMFRTDVVNQSSDGLDSGFFEALNNPSRMFPPNLVESGDKDDAITARGD